jgi:hypothetical protein
MLLQSKIAVIYGAGQHNEQYLGDNERRETND